MYQKHSCKKIAPKTQLQKDCTKNTIAKKNCAKVGALK